MKQNLKRKSETSQEQSNSLEGWDFIYDSKNTYGSLTRRCHHQGKCSSGMSQPILPGGSMSFHLFSV